MKNNIRSLYLALSLSLAVVAISGWAGCAGTDHERSTGEYIDDKVVTSRVKSALEDDPAYKFDDVTVTMFRGTAQLGGFVNSSEQKKKASEITEKVHGVKKVENNIMLKEKTQ